MSAAPSFGIESSAAKASLGKSVVVKGHLLSGEDLTIDGEVEAASRWSIIVSRLPNRESPGRRQRARYRDLGVHRRPVRGSEPSAYPQGCEVCR